MYKTNRILTVLATGLLLALPAQAQQFINVLTGGTSGIYYPLGVSLTQIYGKAIPEAKSTVQAARAGRNYKPAAASPWAGLRRA